MVTPRLVQRPDRVLRCLGMPESAAWRTVGGIGAPVLYAGPQGVQPGLDQFNVLIPPEVATGGPQVVPIVFTAAGQTANTVNVTVQ